MSSRVRQILVQMKPPMTNARHSEADNQALRQAFKWMNIPKDVSKFRSHEDADDWWKAHFLNAHRRATDAGSADVFLLRQLLESQGITPPE